MTPVPRLSLSEQIASQAEFIVNTLRRTKYQIHETIDVDRGVYDCDCNGFVGFVVERSAPAHYAIIPKEPNRSRPRAFEYFEFFNALTPHSEGGWHRINLLRDARRGDILAWRFPEGHKGATGHVFFVGETPAVDEDGIFSVRVYDSASHPHFDDTRGSGEGEFPDGVGSGLIRFLVDDSGRPTSFRFAPRDEFEHLPIAIGRVEPLPSPIPQRETFR